MTTSNTSKKDCCSLCGNGGKGVKLAKISLVLLCPNCLMIVHDNLIKQENLDNSTFEEKVEAVSLLKPSEINALLDEYVVGQEVAKNKLAVAIYNHQKMLRYKDKNIDNKNAIELDKSNVIMVGPTGSGKTFLLKTIAKQLGMPLAIEDATSLTEAGYVGNDVENCLLKLIQAADWDIEKAQRGIIFLDEIDKIGRKGENVSVTRDVSGEGVQQALLKIVEGCIADVPPKGGRKHPTQETIKFDTSNVLFIIGGSFEGIEKMISKRKQGKSSLGFTSSVVDKSKIEFNDCIHDIRIDDLKKFGMLPEFLGRFPVIATLEELGVEALRNILTKPKNALTKQYITLMKEDDIDLVFTDESLDAIAEKAIASKIGARGLRAIIDDILLDIIYSAPDENIERIIVQKDLSIYKEYKKIAQ